MAVWFIIKYTLPVDEGAPKKLQPQGAFDRETPFINQHHYKSLQQQLETPFHHNPSASVRLITPGIGIAATIKQGVKEIC
jgi:hypothetical protein